MKAVFAVALLAVAMLCASTMAQENTSVNQFGISQDISGRNPFQGAIQDYDRALKLDPGNASAWLGKAYISQILGNHSGSKEFFQKALDSTNKTLNDNPEDAKSWQARGVALAGLSRNEDAIRSLEKSIAILDQKLEKNSGDADSWWLKAVSYEALYMDSEAIQAYKKVIELNSTKAAGAWIRIADILFVKVNGYNESVKAFSNAIKLMPDNAAWVGGSVLDQENSVLHMDIWGDDNKILRVTIGSYNKTKKEYDFIQQIVSKPVSTWLFRDNSIDSLKTNAEFIAAAIKLQENTASYWLKKGYELMGNRSYEEAITAMQKAVELDPENATLWDAKAQSLAFAVSFSGNRSQYNESLKAEDKAIELDPNNSTLLVHKGFLIANLADISGHGNESLYEDAIKEFDKAILLNPQDKDAWNWKGMVLDTRLNRTSEAVAAYDKVIEIDGTNASDKVLLANAWSAKGGALVKLGRYNESTAAFDKAIELDPQNAANIWYMRADAINDSGRYDEAVKAYDNVINLSKENVTIALAYEGKGTSLFKLGRYDEAVTAYDKAIQLFPLEQMSGLAWYKKGAALKALGGQSEADAAYAKAKELGYGG